jgi:predicted cupin superfamily sugar epimerase
VLDPAEVAADEVWRHYAGGPLRPHLLGQGERRLGPGQPQAVVPAGTWQAAEPGGEGVLVGRTVAPGFDFADFELGESEALLRAFPGDAGLIRRLAR